MEILGIVAIVVVAIVMAYFHRNNNDKPNKTIIINNPNQSKENRDSEDKNNPFKIKYLVLLILGFFMIIILIPLASYFSNKENVKMSIDIIDRINASIEPADEKDNDDVRESNDNITCEEDEEVKTKETLVSDLNNDEDLPKETDVLDLNDDEDLFENTNHITEDIDYPDYFEYLTESGDNCFDIVYRVYLNAENWTEEEQRRCVENLEQINNLGNTLPVNKVIKLPLEKDLMRLYVVEKKDSLENILKDISTKYFDGTNNYDTDVKKINHNTEIDEGTILIIPNIYIKHKMQKGDTIMDLCAKNDIDYSTRILVINGIKNEKEIGINQTIRLPKFQTF